MVATLAKARDAFAVPKPAPCLCGGLLPCCPECNGTGIGRAWFRLKAARTLAYRRVIFQPAKNGGAGWLKIATSRKEGGTLTVAEYAVEEFPNQHRGRSFYVKKVGEQDKYVAFIGDDGTCSCTCKGGNYESAEKADRKAFRCGEPVFRSKGCTHSDALSELVTHGWLDSRGSR